MASIEVRKLRDGTKVYRVRFRLDGRNRAVQFEAIDRDDALDFRADVEVNAGRALARLERLNAPAVSASSSPAPTLLTAALAHAEGTNTRAQREHRQKMRRNFERHLGELGDLALDEVTRELVQEWADDLVADGYAYKTIKNLRSDVSTVYKYAILDPKLPSVMVNPVKGTTINADPDEAREPVFLKRWEYESVAGFLSGEDLVYVETLAGTGLRKGEALALRVDDLDLDADEPAVLVDKAIKHAHDGNHRVGRTKTRAGRRVVTIDPDLVARLREHVRGRGRYDLVFAAHGNDGTWQRNVWVPAIDSAGLPDDRRPRIHDLRHSHASWLLETPGFDLFKVSKRLGHAKLATTSDIYGHLDRSGITGADLSRALRRERPALRVV